MDSSTYLKTYLPALLIALLLSVGGALAAPASINTLGSNYGLLLSGAINSCTTGTQYSCSDSAFPVTQEVAPFLSDYVYSYGEDPKLKQKNGGSQLSLSWYGVSSVGSGAWYLQVLNDADDFNIVVVPYINETQPSTSGADVITLNMASKKTWYDMDVTSAVVKSFNALGYVKLRIATTDGTDKQLDEMFLIVPLGSAVNGKVIDSYFQIIPQGVAQSDGNQLVINEWKLVKLSSVLNTSISSPSCAVYSTNGSVTSISVSSTVSNVSSDTTLTATWFANTSSIVEGQNYRVSCQMSVLGSNITGLEQYVYVSRQTSIWSSIQAFVVYIGQIIGLARNPVTVTVIPEYVSTNPTTNIVVSVAKGAVQVPSNSTLCRMTVIDSVGTVVVNNQSTTSFGVASLGMINYTMNSTAGAGAPYTVRTVCSVNDSANTFNEYLGVGRLQLPALTISQIFEGLPTVEMFQTRLIAGVPSQILAQVKIGSSNIVNANCGLTIYNSTLGKIVNNQSMTYSGDDGVYNYSWAAPFELHVAGSKVSCSGGSLLTYTVQDTAAIDIIDKYVNMMAIS